MIRIEDLDRGRVREHFVSEQLSDLNAIGLEWDGAPVRQSDRTALYSQALQDLQSRGLIYECWCTRAEIREAASAPHGDQVEGAYPGTCRELTRAQRELRRSEGRPAALRVRAESALVAVSDRLHGALSAEVDDFVVRRGDGAFAYNLAVVVDDEDQGIGEIVRGDDLLSSTPRQVWLQRQLSLPTPGYAHVPLMLGGDGTRLAKRHGAVTLADRAALGENPAAVRAVLAAQLGLCDQGEAISAEALIGCFRERVLHAGAP